MSEIWRDCIGFEGFYEVSDLGNVRRKGKQTNLAKPRDKDGYVIHCFCIKNQRTNVMAHQLVAEAFNGPRPNGLVSRHFDGNKLNNVPSNLKYGTHKENSDDIDRHGTRPKGETSPVSIFTEQDVLVIRASTKSQDELARLYRTSQSNISLIKHRKTWRHI